MKSRTVFFFLVITVLPFLHAVDVMPAADQDNIAVKPLIVRELPEFRITKGQVLYGRYCSFCHGESGTGEGLNAFSIPDKPISFSRKELMAPKTDEELEKVILSGGAEQGMSPYMPPFGSTFSKLEAQHLIRYIRHAF